MEKYTVSLGDLTSLPAEIDSAVTTLETLLQDLEPIESKLPLPSSVKAGFADLEKFLAVAKSFLDKVS